MNLLGKGTLPGLLALALALAACGGGGGGGGSTSPTAQVTLSGRITFERVPFRPVPQSTLEPGGLDYSRTTEVPAREVEVELLRSADQEVLATTSTDVSGNFSLLAPSNTSVKLRAKALSRSSRSGSRPAAWDLRVLNNTNSNALYVLDSAIFNSGTANQTRNLKAATGWRGTSYTGPRAAAPFAILDSLYEAVQFVVTNGDGAIQLPALRAFWSPENRSSDFWDPASGNIISTQFVSSTPPSAEDGIYVLGSADLGAASDSDEFDQHVVAHEFQHFLESALSRNDSPGGPHSFSDLLDMRVSFSEGYSDAFAAMVLDDPVYRDSYGTAQGSDIHFDLESEVSPVPGWYSEISVARIAWDLFDPANSAEGDDVSVGFGAMLDVTRTALRNESPLGSLFAFTAALRTKVDAATASAIDTRVDGEGEIAVPTDPYAANETDSGAIDPGIVIPVYTETAVGGAPRELCTDSSGGTMTYNKIGNRRFLRFEVPSARTLTVQVTCPATDPTCFTCPATDPTCPEASKQMPDPDFVLSRGRDVWFAESATPRTETLQEAVPAGAFVLEIYEYSHIDPGATAPRGQTCMTVTITG